MPLKSFGLMCRASFVTPPFISLANWPRLQAALFAELRDFGVEAKDLQLEGPSFQPRDLVLVCHLLRHDATIKIRLETLEVWTSSEATAEASDIVRSLSERALASLRTQDTTLESKPFSYEAWGHFELGTPLRAVLARYVTSAPPLGIPMRPAGVAYAVFADSGREGEPPVALVNLDPSFLHPGPNNFFVRVLYSASLEGGDHQRKAIALFKEFTATLGREAAEG